MSYVKDDDQAMWFEYHDIKVVDKKGGKAAILPIPCRYLKDGRCLIYENRPQVCRDYNCEEE